MHILETDIPYFYSLFHGYPYIKKYFKGPLVHEIFATIHDTKTKLSSYLYIFITTKNIVMFAHYLNEQEDVIFELDSTDRCSIYEDGNKKLAEIVAATPNSETNLSVKTTRPIQLIQLNDLYFILTDIQADLQYGEFKLNILTLYFISADDRQKLMNLCKLLNDVIAGKKDGLTGEGLSGLSPFWSMFNIYAGITLFILSQFFIFSILIFDPSSRLVAGIFEFFIIYTFYTQMTKKSGAKPRINKVS